MNNRLLLLLAISIIFLLQSCGLIEFTHTSRSEFEKRKISIDKIQFYNSEKIILHRIIDTGEIVNLSASGKIKIENGQQIEEIIFEQHTPGICVEVRQNSLKVQFEEGELNYLLFGIGEDEHIENNYGVYGYSWISLEGGYTQYNGKKYKIVKGGNCILLMKNNDKNTIEKKSRNVKGLKV